MLCAASVATFVAYDRAAQAGFDQTLNVLGLLGQRSPGQRTEAALTKVKRARPDSAALGTEFAPADVAAATEALGLAAPEQLLAPGLAEPFVAPPAVIGGSSAGPGRLGTSPPSLLFVGGGRGGGGGGSGGGPGPSGQTHNDEPSPEPSPDPTLEPTLHAAVPEPGTWATMLAGMALCGFALRRPRKPGRSGAKRPCAVA